jgi:hypothetical protein
MFFWNVANVVRSSYKGERLQHVDLEEELGWSCEKSMEL